MSVFLFKDSSYKTSFIWAGSIHIVILVLLLLKFNPPSYQSPTDNNIMHATTISDFNTDFNPGTPNNPVTPNTPPALHPALPPQTQPKVATPAASPTIIPKQETATIAIKANKSKIIKQNVKQEIEKNLAREAAALAAQKQKELLDKNLSQELSSEKATLDAAAAERAQGTIDKYKAAILQTISANWIVPPGLSDNLECVLLINLAPKGIVVAVQVLQSSGQSLLDQSAKTAVLKSSPLPVPDDLDLFDEFRSIKLTVRPKNAGELNW